MKAERLQLASGLTRIFSGFSRRSAGGRRARADNSALDLLAAHTWRSDERARRASVLTELYRHHAVATADQNGDITYRDTLPPDVWVNNQLMRRGESWRVHNIDGFRCEIYDA